MSIARTAAPAPRAVDVGRRHRPRDAASAGLGGLLLLGALLVLRAEHAVWLHADPDYPSFRRGLLARVLVLCGGLAWARLFTRGATGKAKLGGVARGGFYLVVLWLCATCLEPYTRSAALTWSAAAAGLFALGLGAIEPARRRAPHVVRFVDIALANVCLTLVGLELGLSVLAAVAPTPLLTLETDTRGRAFYEQNRLAPLTDNYGSPTNEWGDADGPPRVLPAEACSVVAIGDSFSVGIVPQPYHFTTVAEREGECDVYNMGAPSIGPTEYLYLLTNRAPLLSADAIVVNLYLFNDIWDVQRSETARAPWLSRERRRTYRVGERLWRAFEQRGEGVFDAPPVARPGASLEERFEWLLDPMLEVPTFSAERYLEIQTGNAMAALSDVVSEPNWAPFFAALTRMIEAAGERLLFLLLPGEPQVEDDVWAQVLALSEHPLERDAAQRRVGAWLAERGVAFLDVLPALRDAEPLDDGRRHVFHSRDTHLNARGNAIVGRELARFLTEEVTP